MHHLPHNRPSRPREQSITVCPHSIFRHQLLLLFILFATSTPPLTSPSPSRYQDPTLPRQISLSSPIHHNHNSNRAWPRLVPIPSSSPLTTPPFFSPFTTLRTIASERRQRSPRERLHYRPDVRDAPPPSRHFQAQRPGRLRPRHRNGGSGGFGRRDRP